MIYLDSAPIMAYLCGSWSKYFSLICVSVIGKIYSCGGSFLNQDEDAAWSALQKMADNSSLDASTSGRRANLIASKKGRMYGISKMDFVGNTKDTLAKSIAHILHIINQVAMTVPSTIVHVVNESDKTGADQKLKMRLNR